MVLVGTEPNQSADDHYDGDQIVLPDVFSGWCQSPRDYLGATTEQLCHPEPSVVIRISSPRDGARFVLDPSIFKDVQRLPFVTEHPMSEKLEWYLNDSFIPNASALPLIWKLKVGTWKLLVRDPMSGREGQCEFVVVH